MREFLAKYIDDILLLIGCVFILYGLSMWSSVITWIVAGLMLISFGIMIGKVRI